jgi:predicted lipoprotein with Yx(FWY)xxD motif
VPNMRLLALPAILAAVIVAGCGSTSHSTSTAASQASSAAATQASAAPPASSLVVTSKHTKLGTILGAGPKQLTVYLFEGDKTGMSSCTGACAAAWPPVTGKPAVAGSAMSADLGTITRSDGSTQVTYKGHPLYFFIKDIKDGDSGDTYGQAVKAFGADWYAVAPSGEKIDNS